MEELVNQVKIQQNQNYPTSMGEYFFREGVARWHKVRYGVDLDPEKEVSHVLGGKDGVANIVRAFVNPGDVVLCPNPGYPVYENG
ncbi:MAG TPA: aminotransferase class I/II-fold pyridoxal phosphate-dependent enzyme, partial [Candidatus Lokiarchaeia archaeon]